MKRSSKRKYLETKISEKEKDPKKLWEILKEATNNTTQKDEIEPDDVNEKTADIFNEYFACVGKIIQEKLGIHTTEENYCEPNNQPDGFIFKHLSPEQVDKIIKSLRPTVATGHCRIPARIFIDLSEAVSNDLCNLINLGYDSGQSRHMPMTPRS